MKRIERFVNLDCPQCLFSTFKTPTDLFSENKITLEDPMSGATLDQRSFQICHLGKVRMATSERWHLWWDMGVRTLLTEERA